MSTGLYRVSIATRAKTARADVNRARKSLDSLKNQCSPYANEHRALLTVLTAVAEIYESAPTLEGESK